MRYDTGKHCVFYHRYHLIWSTKYCYKVLTGALRLRGRDICRQVCRENEVDILRGVLSSDHVHMIMSVPRMISHFRSGAHVEGPFVLPGAAGIPAYHAGYAVQTSGSRFIEMLMELFQGIS